MKFKTTRDEEPKEVQRITVYIGEDRYWFTESNQGRLKIVKYSDGSSENLNIHPCVANSIEIS